MPTPLSHVGTSERDANGRFLPGNRAALVSGARSTAFCDAVAGIRNEFVDGVLADQGVSRDTAPRALLASANGLAQAMLLRDACFERIVEAGGPTTSLGRTRRQAVLWKAFDTQVIGHLRVIGIHRAPKPTQSLAEALAAQVVDRTPEAAE
jgi:hypothetical protein